MMSLYLQGVFRAIRRWRQFIYLPVPSGALCRRCRPTGRPVRQPPVAGDFRCDDHLAAVMLLFRHRNRSGVMLSSAAYGIGFASDQRAWSRMRPVSGMPRDRPVRRLGDHLDQSSSRCEHGVALCAGRWPVPLAATHVGFTEAPGPLWIINVVWVWSLRCYCDLDIGAGEGVRAATGAAIADGGRGGPCRMILSPTVWRAMSSLVLENRDAWRRSVVRTDRPALHAGSHSQAARPASVGGNRSRRRRLSTPRPRRVAINVTSRGLSSARSIPEKPA